jgi:FdhD protein
MMAGMDVAGLLLTGGLSRRMGRDKATLASGGTTLARRSAALLAAVAEPVLELGPGVSGLTAVPDAPGPAGPLAAVAGGVAALRAAGWGGAALVVATDLPLLERRLLEWLAAHPFDGSVVAVAGGRPQWMCGRYSAEVLDAAGVLVASGRRAMADLAGAGDLHLAGADEWAGVADRAALADVDTPSEWAAVAGGAPGGGARGAGRGGRAARAGPVRAVTDVRAVKVRPDRWVELPDQLATEEPLEIRAAGPGQIPAAVAVTMRTPGADFELAAGFLVSEGLVAAGDVAAVGYCDTTDPEHRFNTVTVSLRVPWVPPAGGRAFAVTSSCGVCGKAGIDQVELACPAVGTAPPVPASVLPLLPGRLRAAQRVFDRTGGLHAAGRFDAAGTLLCSREDVGRHNAVDKVIGHAVLAAAAGGAAPDGKVLMVSGRVSFEVVQKAAMGGLAVVAAVSAPSSLAVEAAERLGVTVAGFVRGSTFNLYSHPERVDLDA